MYSLKLNSRVGRTELGWWSKVAGTWRHRNQSSGTKFSTTTERGWTSTKTSQWSTWTDRRRRTANSRTRRTGKGAGRRVIPLWREPARRTRSFRTTGAAAWRQKSRTRKLKWHSIAFCHRNFRRLKQFTTQSTTPSRFVVEKNMWNF